MNRDQEYYEKFKAKLSPARIKLNLTLASLYICAYETLILTITNCVENAEFMKFDTNGWIIGKELNMKDIKKFEEVTGVKVKGTGSVEDIEKIIKKMLEYKYKEKYKKYEKKVRPKNGDTISLTSQVYIPCLWLVENEVIDEDEIETIEKITYHRNQIAHKLPRFLIDLDLEINLDYLERTIELYSKIDRWSVELESLLEPDPELRQAERYSFRSILLHQVLSAALSDYTDV